MKKQKHNKAEEANPMESQTQKFRANGPNEPGIEAIWAGSFGTRGFLAPDFKCDIEIVRDPYEKINQDDSLSGTHTNLKKKKTKIKKQHKKKIKQHIQNIFKNMKTREATPHGI